MMTTNEWIRFSFKRFVFDKMMMRLIGLSRFGENVLSRSRTAIFLSMVLMIERNSC